MVNTRKLKSKDKAYPTIFVLEGSVRIYEDGSMLDLHEQLSTDQWESIVGETIKYKVFVECLKAIAIPILNEKWTDADDWYRLQLNTAVSRMRNIDPLLLVQYNEYKIADIYIKSMKTNAQEMNKYIELIKDQSEMLEDEINKETIRVSKL